MSGIPAHTPAPRALPNLGRRLWPAFAVIVLFWVAVFGAVGARFGLAGVLYCAALVAFFAAGAMAAGRSA